VTLSGDKVPMHVVWEIKQVIFGGGLRYHKEKRAVDRSAEVTGVILEKGEMLPPNRVRRKRRTLERAKDAERRPGENTGAIDDPFQVAGLASAQDTSVDLNAAGAKQQAIFLLACVPERRIGLRVRGFAPTPPDQISINGATGGEDGKGQECGAHLGSLLWTRHN
jgi:hypothetical protein